MPNPNNDIEKYLRGELSAAEMHNLEKRALKDPFLAEALEGAEQAGIESFSLDLELLEKDIRKKTRRREPRIISIHSWKFYTGIAAGLALLAISSYILITMIWQQQQDHQLALSEKVVPQQVQEPSADPRVASDSVVSTNEVHAEETTTAASPNTTRSNVTRNGSESTLGERGEARTNEDAVTPNEGDIATLQHETIAETERQQTPVITSDTTSVARALEENVAGVHVQRAGAPAKIVRGKVTYAEDGTPLPGVNVLIKGTSIGTVTDLEGNYQLNLGNTQDELVFAFIGYASREVSVKDQNEINVALNADVTQLSEVVVTGVSKQRNEESNPTLYLAEPTVGRKAYQQYLVEQLNYPEQAIENKIEGRVTIQFTVEPNGQLSNFTVLKGLGHGCDDEVIRLIKQGPAWTPTRKDNQPVSDKVKIRLKFQLPGE
jgi:TonB family protein